MKRLVSAASLVVLLIAISAMAAWAKGPANVSMTIHNLSTSAPGFTNGFQSDMYASANVSQVCVFCHTPHGGRIDGPLWNRNLPAAIGAFTHYSSYTLSNSVIGAAGRAVGDESRLCMSCHDGSATLDHLINPPNEIGANPVNVAGGPPNQAIQFIPEVAGGVIGNLSDDHPISFSYDSVVGQALYGGAGGRAGELHTIVEAKTAGVRFFGGNNRVECSSCHDPHVNYNADEGGNSAYAPFLITPNAGSNLCRACHNK